MISASVRLGKDIDLMMGGSFMEEETIKLRTEGEGEIQLTSGRDDS